MLVNPGSRKGASSRTQAFRGDNRFAVMFQIVSTMALELLSFLEELEYLRGVSPNVQLPDEPWGHNNHEDVDCGCQTSDRTAAYVHDLTVNGLFIPLTRE